MQYSFAAVLALAATVSATYKNETIVYTTEVVDTYVTVCPAQTTLTYQGVTYTNTLTESSTITITNCPCTVSKPVYTTSSVYCNTCAVPTHVPVYPNATTPVVSYPASTPVGTVSVPVGTSTPAPSNIPASGANKAFAMSGASLAGLLGLAAYLL